MTDIKNYVKVNFCIFEKWGTFGPNSAKVGKFNNFCLIDVMLIKCYVVVGI